MAVGDILSNTFETIEDPDTHVALERLTPRGTTCHHMRFNQRNITRDSLFMLYSAELNGMRRICALNLETGQAVQLTSGRNVADYSGTLSADDRYLYYIQADSIFRINLFTLLRERIYVAKKGWSLKTFTINEVGTKLAVTEIYGSFLPTFLDSADWTAFSLSSIVPPVSRIVLVDIESGSSSVVLEEQQWIGQAQIRPRHDDELMFCHEGPYDSIDARLWLVKSDGTDVRCAREQDDKTIITQEFWWPDGSKIGYYYARVNSDARPSIRTLDPTNQEELILAECSPYVHCMIGKSGRFCVGDSMGSSTPIHTVEQEDGLSTIKDEAIHDYIYLLDVEKHYEFRLCHHRSSWSLRYGTTQDAHPHPYLSDDGRWVFFTSDFEGAPAVYRVDVGRFLWEHLGHEYSDDVSEVPSWGLAATFLPTSH